MKPSQDNTAVARNHPSPAQSSVNRGFVCALAVAINGGICPICSPRRSKFASGAFFDQIRQMLNMKSTRLLLLVTSALFAMTVLAAARAVRIWSYEELLEKSELVVLATPTATNDTKEHVDLPGFSGEHLVGVETRFIPSAVLKGDKALKSFVLHHYRTADGTNMPHLPNGPGFVSFTPAQSPNGIQRTYILFLVREPDGRYAPVVGQADPGFAVKELVSSGE